MPVFPQQVRNKLAQAKVRCVMSFLKCHYNNRLVSAAENYLDVKIRGAFKKFCNSIWCTNDTSKIFMLLFNIITLNTNAYVTFIKKLFYAGQIEFLLHAPQVRLRGLFDCVIIFEPCSCYAGCSNEHWIGIVVIPTLLNRPSTQCLRSILLSEEVVPRWPWHLLKKFLRGHVWTVPGIMPVNSVALSVFWEIVHII